MGKYTTDLKSTFENNAVFLLVKLSHRYRIIRPKLWQNEILAHFWAKDALGVKECIFAFRDV